MSTLSIIQNEAINWVKPELDNVFEKDLHEDITVKAAMYSIEAGGKRIRPLMMYMTGKMCGASKEDMNTIKAFAATLELIHTYSLIHDDLPCMDNDDLRRGKPTCHKAFNEGIATLAGDCLLNLAYERLFEIIETNPEYSYAASKMAELAGIYGMIGGQSIDLESEGKKIELERLYELQAKKTGALIESAIVTPYYIINKVSRNEVANDEIACLLIKLAAHIGLSFQIKDDLLDVTSSAEVLGKNVGKDERDFKSTFVTLLGFENAELKLNEEINSAYEVLAELENKGYDTNDYKALVDYMINRVN